MKPADGIDLLLGRLTWPSVIARERAATETARLLISHEHGQAVRDRLLTWTAEQRLETRAAVGLLAFARARMLDTDYEPPDGAELNAAIRRPSLLSILLKRELERGGKGSENNPWSLDVADMNAPHSGDAPTSYRPPRAFAQTEHLRFLASNHFTGARHIERQSGLPLMRQWAFEWERLAAEAGLDTNRNERHFWYGNLRHEFVTVDTLLSDVYRSAYLRTVAWCAGTGRMPVSIVVSLAARICPLDLGLWAVNPQVRPVWWPTADRPKGEIDTVPAQLWRQAEELWAGQSAGGIVGDPWVIAHAEGFLYGGGSDDEGTAYRLEIGGLFQQCHGPAAPDEDAVSRWYFGRHAVLAPWGDSPLRFEGVIGTGPPDAAELGRALGHFADASFLPAADLAAPSAWPRWQHWRAPQGIAVPSRLLSMDAPIFCRATHDGFEFLLNGAIIGVWRDWAQAVRERGDPAVSSVCGNFLLLRRDLVESFAAESGSVYMWVCRVMGRPRKDRFGQRQEPAVTTRFMGRTAIVRP